MCTLSQLHLHTLASIGWSGKKFHSIHPACTSMEYPAGKITVPVPGSIHKGLSSGPSTCNLQAIGLQTSTMHHTGTLALCIRFSGAAFSKMIIPALQDSCSKLHIHTLLMIIISGTQNSYLSFLQKHNF